MGQLAPPLLSAAAELADDDFVPGAPDDIDPELWEIFEEEASELLQQLHGRLRDWTAQHHWPLLLVTPIDGVYAVLEASPVSGA